MVTELQDLRLDENREVGVGSDGDLELTEGVETVEQSVGINAGGAVRSLIGEPLTGSTYNDAESEIESALSDDSHISSIQSAEVVEVNRSTGTVTVRVHTSYDESIDMVIQ